ncbi:MAG: hypothetical protein K6G62_00715, partial [Eubacterium sp.]|nr:hypothetical protein [Eubacterium sp.]
PRDVFHFAEKGLAIGIFSRVLTALNNGISKKDLDIITSEYSAGQVDEIIDGFKNGLKLKEVKIYSDVRISAPEMGAIKKKLCDGEDVSDALRFVGFKPNISAFLRSCADKERQEALIRIAKIGYDLRQLKLIDEIIEDTSVDVANYCLASETKLSYKELLERKDLLSQDNISYIENVFPEKTFSLPQQAVLIRAMREKLPFPKLRKLANPRFTALEMNLLLSSML